MGGSQGRAPVLFPRLVLPKVQDSGLRNVSRLSARGGVEEVGNAPKGGWPAREKGLEENPNLGGSSQTETRPYSPHHPLVLVGQVKSNLPHP